MSKRIWIGFVVLLSALCLAKATIPSSIVENVQHQEEVVSIGNIEALSCALECRDASTSNAISVTPAMGAPLRYIPRHNTPNAISAICLSGLRRFSHSENLDSNSRGQFCSANLPYSICNLLI